jgi:phosphatidylglycerophosphatase A
MRLIAQIGTPTLLEKWASWIATGMGVGYFPVMPGTVGSLVGFFLFLLLRDLSTVGSSCVLIFLFAIGVYTSSVSESFFKMKDSSRIVIDEIFAMLLVCFLLPKSLGWGAAGFILFRLFDITKPPPIRRLEKLQGGWGVMMDDLLAAGYTVGLLRLSEKIYAMILA